MGVMVAQPMWIAQKEQPGRSTRLRKPSQAHSSHIQDLFAEHNLHMSDEEFHTALTEAADLRIPQEVARPAAEQKTGAELGLFAAHPSVLDGGPARGSALAQVQEESDEELADYSDGCRTRVRAASDAFHNRSTGVQGQVMDYESAAPWYCYSTVKEGTVGHGSEESNVHRVTLFDRINVHGGARTVTSTPKSWGIPAGFKWGRAALHFRLDHPRWPGEGKNGHPYGEDFDFWDRLGSLGFHLPGDGEHLSLFPADETRQREWSLKATAAAEASTAPSSVAEGQGQQQPRRRPTARGGRRHEPVV